MKRHLWMVVFAVIFILVAFAVWQFMILRIAHSSFANYAQFRGCATIASRSDTTGTCMLANGQSIAMVKFAGRWYLHGDLPFCWWKICF